jgi:hypothetical protein
MIEPLTMLGAEDQIPRLLYRFALTNRFIMQGRERAAAESLGSLAPCFRQPKIVAAVGEGQSKAMYGGVLYVQAIMECFQFGQRALEITREMDSLGVQAWVIAAEQVRLLYHAYRGESENFELCRERVELFAVQGDSTWQMEVFLPATLLIANLLTGDTVAARRDAEQLARRAEHLPSLEPFARLAQASYLSLRGDLTGAIAEFERVLPDFAPHGRFGWLSMRGQFADALNRAGQHARAKQLTLDGLSCSPREDYVSVMQHLERSASSRSPKPASVTMRARSSCSMVCWPSTATRTIACSSASCTRRARRSRCRWRMSQPCVRISRRWSSAFAPREIPR